MIDISSELPLGAGLGSSASVCVSLSCAFLALCCVISKDSLQPRDISQSDLHLVNSWAFEGEKILHGTPSGIDNSVVTFGKLLKTLNLYCCSKSCIIIANNNLAHAFHSLHLSKMQLVIKALPPIVQVIVNSRQNAFPF